MSAKRMGTWLVLIALLIGPWPAYGDTRAEIAAKLGRARAALTTTRGQLTPAQWALLSSKLASAEKALADYSQLVAETGQAAAAAEASAAVSSEALAAEGEVAAAEGAASVLGTMGVIFAALINMESDEDPRLYESRQKRRLEEQLQELGRTAEQVKAEIEQATRSPVVPQPTGSDDEEDEDGDIHHIATDKNEKSEARGGPWTPLFRDIFKKAGMELNDPANKTRVKGHRGPHPAEYHEEVRDRLLTATADCRAVAQCRERLTTALRALAIQCSTPGMKLNRLITTPAAR